jgi:hypothetical protein
MEERPLEDILAELLAGGEVSDQYACQITSALLVQA